MDKKMNLFDLGYLLGGTVIGFIIHRLVNEYMYRKFVRKED